MTSLCLRLGLNFSRVLTCICDGVSIPVRTVGPHYKRPKHTAAGVLVPALLPDSSFLLMHHPTPEGQQVVVKSLLPTTPRRP